MGNEEAKAASTAMGANDLAVILFLLGVAATFYATTISPEDKRARAVLKVISTGLVIAAIAWLPLRLLFPTLAGSGFVATVVSVASNAWAWFILLMVTLLATSLIPALEQRRMGQSAPMAATQVPLLQVNEIIFPSPSKNGVLWRSVPGVGMSGPYCPTHRIPLFYWPTHGVRRAEVKEDDWLSGNASFVCPSDDEEFTFIRPTTMKVGQLRAQAAEKFQSEVERAKIEDALLQARHPEK